MITDPPYILFNLPTRGGISTKCFEGFMAFSDFARENGIAYDIEIMNGCSIIPLGRSVMFSKALTDPNWTHMMWIDDDIGWKPEDIMFLLMHDKDIIGGSYPKKTYPIQVTHNPLKNSKGYEDKRLQEVKAIPTGFMMLSRKLCEDMAKHYEHLKFTFGDSQDYPYIDVFGCSLYHDPKNPELTKDTSGYYLTEDYAFCQRARDIGYSIYLSKKIALSHTGEHTFEFADKKGHRYDVL